MTRLLTPEQQDRVLDLLTELAREGESSACDQLERMEGETYDEGDQDARNEIADRCASLLREIRGYV